MNVMMQIDSAVSACQAVFDNRETVVSELTIEQALPMLRQALEMERTLRGKRRGAAMRVARILETAIGARLNEQDEATAGRAA
jgi:hypothetical protein